MDHAVLNEATWVVGCSEQRPNDVLAYEVMGIADGHVLLSRHDGVSYTTSSGEIRSYQRTRDDMLRLVLAGVPASLRHGVGQALIRRWNREWGVEPEAGHRPGDRQRLRHGDRDLDLGQRRPDLRGEVTQLDLATSRQDGGVLDRASELADVPRKTKRRQGVPGGR